MKEKSVKIISIVFGILAFLLMMLFSIVQMLSILSNSFVVVSGLIGGLFNLILVSLTSFLFFILGSLILFNSVSFNYSLSDPNKRSRRLIFIGLFLSAFSIYQCVNILFQKDWHDLQYLLSLFLFGGSLLAGILSIAIGFLRVYFINIPKTDNSYIIKRKKFLKKIQKPIILTLLFLIAVIIFNIYRINEMDFRGSINDLELDGKLVFLRINSAPFSPKSEPENYYNGNNLCMVDLRYPTEINCFDKSEEDPYWGPDGENIFYIQKDEDNVYHTVVYNIINGEKEILDDNQKTYNDYYGLYGTSRKYQEEVFTKIKSSISTDPRAIASPHNPYTRISISPDSKKVTYFGSGRSIYLLKENEYIITLLKYEPDNSENSFQYPIWYSNTQILFEGKIINNKIFTKDKYISGFFLMNEDGSNIRLIVPDNDDYFYYKSPNLYR